MVSILKMMGIANGPNVDQLERKVNMFYCFTVGMLLVFEIPNSVNTYRDPGGVTGLGVHFFQRYLDARKNNEKKIVDMADQLSYQVSTFKVLGFGLMGLTLFADNKTRFAAISWHTFQLFLMKFFVVDVMVKLKKDNQLSQTGNEWMPKIQRNLQFIAIPVFLAATAGQGYIYFKNQS